MDGYDDLPPSELARERRRDHDAEAHARAGMKTGLAKQFKQVLDIQKRRADDADAFLNDEDRGRRTEHRRPRPDKG